MKFALVTTLFLTSLTISAKNTEQAIINDLIKREAEIRRYQSDTNAKSKKLKESEASLRDVIQQLSASSARNRQLEQKVIELQSMNEHMYETLEKLGGLTPQMVRQKSQSTTPNRMPASTK